MKTPEDFLGLTPPSRPIGTETECNIQLAAGNEYSGYIDKSALRAADYKFVGSFLDNGMKIYVDVKHLEVASAEGLGPRQAAAANAAGILALNTIVRASGKRHNGLYRNSGSFLGYNHSTRGHHVNFLIPRSLENSDLFDTVMAGHLASDIHSLSGCLAPEGFRLSQKVEDIGGEPAIERGFVRLNDTFVKPMAMIRSAEEDGDTIQDDEWARFERRHADPGQSLTGTFLAYGATSLVLRLIEHADLIDAQKLMEASFVSAPDAAKTFSADLSFQHRALCNDGRHRSALDYQKLLLAEVNTLARKITLPEDELLALRLWKVVYDELRSAHIPAGHYGRLLGIVDFAPRHQYLSELAHQKKIKLTNANDELAMADLNWDRVLPAGEGMKYWRRMPSPFVDRKDVRRFVRHAPPSRASVRANIISDPASPIYVLNWAEVQFVDETEATLLEPVIGLD